jgi:transcription initiation factor TFIID subunit 2
VQHIGFAAGPFETHVIAESPKPILGFCLPEDYDLLVNTTSHFAPAMSYFSTEFGSYPFSEFKLVFLPNTRTSVTTTATMSILSANLLYPPDVIDQAPETRHILSLALVHQWIGINVIQRTLADTWLIHGLALYLNAQYLRHTLGNNEYRFRLKKDIQRCVRLDQGDQWPICIPGSLDPPDINFINLKAPLVLHILDRYLTKAGTSLGLSRVIPRIFLASLSDELPGNALSTQFFFKTCRKVSGLDLSSFQDQWVFGSGCPHFRISTNFIRKKFIVELFMNQTVLAKGKRAVPLFEGSLTVRIHEADGAPFEHVVDIKNAEKTYSLPFNTKYKRTRRSGHVAARFRKLQEDLAAEDMEDAQPKTSDTFAYPPWDDETERQRWRVAEWTDEQVVTMMGEGGGYEWIRIDPDCEWIASFDFNERPWYWISQLQSDRDVVAQLEAIQNMAHHPSPVVASELAKTVLVSNYFYRVRMEAAQALVNVSQRPLRRSL